MGKIKGKSIMVTVNGNTIALSTSCSLQTTTQTSDARTKDDAVGPHNEVEYIDWTVSSESMVGKNEEVTAQQVYDALLALQLAGAEVEVYVELMSNASGKVPTGDWTADTTSKNGFTPYGGKALIDSLNLSAPNEGNATLSASFKANGPLTKKTA